MGYPFYLNITLTVFVFILFRMVASGPKDSKGSRSPKDRKDKFAFAPALPISHYPYVLAIAYFYSERHILRQCCGSAISEILVLSSSHCAQNNAGYVQYGNIELAPKDDQLKRRVLKVILPSDINSNKQQKGVLDPATVGLLIVQELYLEFYGSASRGLNGRNKLMGKIVTYAALRPLNLPKDFSGINFPNPQLFTAIGLVVACPVNAGRFMCVQAQPNALPGRSGGPIFLEDIIVGVINMVLKQNDRILGQIFTFIVVDDYGEFIERERALNIPTSETPSTTIDPDAEPTPPTRFALDETDLQRPLTLEASSAPFKLIDKPPTNGVSFNLNISFSK